MQCAKESECWASQACFLDVFVFSFCVASLFVPALLLFNLESYHALFIFRRGFDPKQPPPFPTFVPNENEPAPENLYHPDLFAMDNDTIIYPKVEEVKRRTGAKLAKIRKK